VRHSCCQARAWERKEAGYLIVADHLGLRLRTRARFAPTGGLPVTSGGTNIQTKPYDKGGSIFGCREGLFFGCHLHYVQDLMEECLPQAFKGVIQEVFFAVEARVADSRGS